MSSCGSVQKNPYFFLHKPMEKLRHYLIGCIIYVSKNEILFWSFA